MPKFTTPAEVSLSDLFSGAAKGIGIAGNALAPNPGASNTNIDTKNWTQQDIAQFIQNLVNSTSLTNTSNLVNTSGEAAGSQKYDLDPQTQALLDQLTSSYSSYAKSPLDFRGYQASGIQGINQNSDLQKQAVDSIMASRGLSTSPVTGTALANLENSRFGQINQFNQQLPLLQNDLIGKNLGQAASFFNLIPKNTSTLNTTAGQQSQAGQTSTVGQQSSTQDVRGTNTSNSTGSQMSRTTVPDKTTGQKVLGVAGGLAGTLASLFSDERLKKNVEVVDKATDVLMKLKPVKWDWIEKSPNGTGGRDSGFLAQDLEKVLPDLVHDDPEGSGYKKVNYAGLLPVVVKAVQELAEEVRG